MAKRPLQEINAGSMADIAFLLLIFFLVTTTMDTNTGMTRKLPQPNTEPTPDIIKKERNVLVVLINKKDQLAVESKLVTLEILHEKVKEFFTNPLKDKNLPETKPKNIPFLGTVEVSKGVISLQNDRGTKYERYIAVQNQLLKAINELRDELSIKKFGSSFENLPENKQNAVKKFYPYAISEAEPMEIK